MTDEAPIEMLITVRIDPTGARALGRLLFEDLPAPVIAGKTTERPNRLLDVNETAAILGISKSSLYSMRYAGEAPPAIKVGSRLRWRRLDVDEWIEDRKT